ncbi:MAG: histidine phosphatase family protein [Bacilli bacterium]|nr:histidine phosphatase family protein [Bacilli bacterium]
MNKTKVYLVRHGFTPANNAGWNKQFGIREYFYRDEFVPLDKTYGVQQAKELGLFLKKFLEGKKVLFIVSPYYRTRETLTYAIEHLDPSNYDVSEEKTIREINQGILYGQPSTYMSDDLEMEINKEERKDKNKVAISYPQGESEIELRRRIRNFSRKLEEYRSKGTYDAIVIVSHETVLKNLYYLMMNQELPIKQKTASVITMEENPKCIFEPETSVPKGYLVDLDLYNNYSMLMKFYQLIEELKQEVKFQKFCNNMKIPLEMASIFIPKKGETLIIPPGNDEKRGYFFIDCTEGQDAYTYDTGSTSTYYVLEGEGVFEIGGYPVEKNGEITIVNSKQQPVKKGDIIVVPKNTIFYYSGNMKLMEKMEPNFVAENVNVVKDIEYSKIKTKK